MELFHNPMIAGIFIPALLLAVAIEAVLYIQMHGRYPWRDGLASLAIALGHSASGIVSHAVITAGIAVVVWHYRIATVDLGNGGTWYCCSCSSSSPIIGTIGKRIWCACSGVPIGSTIRPRN